ncbi:MAG TPA: zinc ABC transporter substrate-binding protein [Bacteroidales bacterium]|nr:zinc ABC transporter substrate-binding protein [Bacteroidales bacterium]HCI55050.1 zinc ABC transporter substrate-binding protein [Bacteroidales bacterium]HRC89915.1 zinc ABC transporter substrate-binding protein [Bacteroidales bacterium]
MRKVLIIIPLIVPLFFLFSCSSHKTNEKSDIITVSISPFAFFIDRIGGEDFQINIMVPPGSDPHIYEPYPSQVAALSNSAAYISNGLLDFEIAWLEKFYSVNSKMKKLNLADSVDLIITEDHGHGINADPHFWLAPLSAMKIASSVKWLLCEIKPERKDKYEQNYFLLIDSIQAIHNKALRLLTPFAGKPVFVYHPTLGYLARDYGFVQISIEKEGKEPSPSWLKEVVDKILENNIGAIFVQKEFDKRNAEVIAGETGTRIIEISTLSRDWFSDINQLIDCIYLSFTDKQIIK